MAFCILYSRPERFSEKLMRLKKNKEFQNVYKNGAYYANKHLVVYVIKNSEKHSSFGITVGKKVGKSVVRSRVTRLIRESIRLNINAIQTGYDIVVLARAGAGEERFKQIESSFLHLIKKHGLLIEHY